MSAEDRFVVVLRPKTWKLGWVLVMVGLGILFLSLIIIKSSSFVVAPQVATVIGVIVGLVGWVLIARAQK